MREETFEGSGGLKIFMRSWRPDSQPRAVMVLVHGFKAHGGILEWAAEQLVQQGLAVYGLDLRGHGRSEGDRLWVESFGDYLADVDRLVEIARAREPGLPVFILGHSAGGVISSGYVLEHQGKLAGFICESFAFEIPAPDIVISLLKGISHVAPHLGVFELNDDDFSRDPAFVDRMKNDPLIPRMRYPSQTAAVLARAQDHLRAAFPHITLPVLIMHGTDDKATRPHGSQFFYDTTGSKDKTLKLYEGHAHDLLNDVGREGVMADIAAWLDAHIAR